MAGDGQGDFPWASLRREMVEVQLLGRGIRDRHVLEAMGGLPREEFVSADQRAAAYEDRPLPVGPGQTISQPYIVAYMTEKLEVSPGDRVLEVGGGTGYQAALLSMMGAQVVALEIDPRLVQEAEARLARLNIKGVRFIRGDGTLGYPDLAPYDRIIVTAGAPRVPPALVHQLREDGRLIMPVGGPAQQILVCVIRNREGTTEHPLIPCRFVKLVGEQGWD
ncbi:MAG: protein-L-isoaspartate(D-aspartate) O-methyltransferase [Planctomycetota bacterium]